MESLDSSTGDGRKNLVSIGDDAINTQALVEGVRDDACGAISTFEGTTRNSFGGKEVTKLEYDAYVPMALKEMLKLCIEARELWPDLYHIAMQHRTGTVPVRESSIVIVVSSPHRSDAIAGCEWLIDELKVRVPVWKKEFYDDGSVWKTNAECLGCSSRRREVPKPTPKENGHGHSHSHEHSHDHAAT